MSKEWKLDNKIDIATQDLFSSVKKEDLIACHAAKQHNLNIGVTSYHAAKSHIKRGADVNAEDEYGLNPLDYACYGYRANEGVNITQLLIENGAIVSDLTLTKQAQKGNVSRHFLAAQWCQNARMGQIDKIPSTLGENPILLLAKIMKGQLVEEGYITKLLELQNIQNEIVQDIINTDNFVEDTTYAIIEKLAVRLCSHRFYCYSDKIDLHTLSEEEQEMVVNKVKSLCGGITIDNEKLSKALESNNLPDHMREEFHKLLCHNEEVLLANMEEASEAVKDEVLLQIEPAAGTSVEISNNHGSNAPMDIDFSGQTPDMHGDNL